MPDNQTGGTIATPTKSFFVFNGQSSIAHGLTIEAFLPRRKPKRRVDRITVPGRQGELLIDHGVYECVDLTYQCWFSGGFGEANALADWLYGVKGYAALADSYDYGSGLLSALAPDFRLAAFTGGLDIENLGNRYGRCDITFRAMPQIFYGAKNRYVAGANVPREGYLRRVYTQAAAQAYPSLPLIRVQFDQTVSLTVNAGDGTAYALQLTTGQDASDVTIDCDTQSVYLTADGTNASAVVGRITDFPRFAPGINSVTALHQLTGEEDLLNLYVNTREWHL